MAVLGDSTQLSSSFGKTGYEYFEKLSSGVTGRRAPNPSSAQGRGGPGVEIKIVYRRTEDHTGPGKGPSDTEISRHLAASASKKRALGKLQGADMRVKSHEQRHLAVLGGLAASGINYNYIIGPNGRRFAVGGSIAVDLEPVHGNPRATIDKAQRLRAAAFAVGDSSIADKRVAAKAYRMEQEAREELKKNMESSGASAGRSLEPASIISVEA